MKIASMHSPIKIGTSIDAINLYERHSLSEYVYILLSVINEGGLCTINDFFISVKDLSILFKINDYFKS